MFKIFTRRSVSSSSSEIEQGPVVVFSKEEQSWVRMRYEDTARRFFKECLEEMWEIERSEGYLLFGTSKLKVHCANGNKPVVFHGEMSRTTTTARTVHWQSRVRPEEAGGGRETGRCLIA